MTAKRVRIGVIIAVAVLAALAAATGFTIQSSRSVAAPDGVTEGAEPDDSEGTRSEHGSDFSLASTDGRTLTTCDAEGDGNPVKGVYDLDTSTSDGNGAIEDQDGAGGTCAQLEVEGVILRHRTCERNHLAWDCDNWISE
ncbi:MAG: hypothetical protein ACRD0U_07805 [Acidimicrobiales bacterium]